VFGVPSGAWGGLLGCSFGALWRLWGFLGAACSRLVHGLANQT